MIDMGLALGLAYPQIEAQIKRGGNMSLYTLSHELDAVLRKAGEFDRLAKAAKEIRPALEAIFEQQPIEIRQSEFWSVLGRIFSEQG